MTNHNHSADTALDGAIHTLQQLDGLGEAAYLQNGGVLIGEAAARAAIADAVTNRIRLLHDLLAVRPATGVVPDREAAVDEYNRLVRSVVTHAEA